MNFQGPTPWHDKYIGGRPVIPIMLDGIALNALLDTGSQISSIPYVLYKRYWADADIDKGPSGVELDIWASNGKLVPQLGFREMTVKIGKVELQNQGLIVVNVDRRNCEPTVLIGMNVMENCFAEVISVLQQIAQTAQSCQQRVLRREIKVLMLKQQVEVAGGEIGSVRVSDPTSIVIPPKTEMLIWCRAAIGAKGRDYQALVEPVYTDSRPTILTARGVVEVHRGRVPVRLLNCGEEEVTLPRYATVGKLYTVDNKAITTIEPLDSSCQVEDNGSDGELEDWCQQLHVGTNSTPTHQKQGVYRLVTEYEQVFSKHPLDFGRIEGVEHAIPTGDHPPIKERYRPIPPAHYQCAKDMLREMKQAGVIRDSCSPWAAPLVIVKKKDGTMRMCVDYRQINNITHKDAYPLPRIEESLSALRSANYFSTLDLTSGYWQVPVAERDKEKTAFTTPMGLCEFNCMPFGLCNAPGTFQRLMECCLGHKNFETVLLYLDDVIVYSKTYEQHLQDLAEVFEALSRYGMKIKPSKCHLLKPKVQYLGHIVSSEGVAPDPEKITAIRDWPRPTSVKEVRQFLGLVGYYRRFIRGFTKLAAPLQDVLVGQTRKPSNRNPPFQWNDEREDSFEKLKKALTGEEVLAYPDYHQPFILYTDASNVGLGAVLSQKQEGREKVIAFASRKLRPTERNPENYSSFKLELLAVVWAVTERFKHYLAAARFTVYTDNNPLTHLDTAKLGALEQRWIARLSNYNFVIKYRAGRKNGNADALSRMPHLRDVEEEPEELEEIELPAFHHPKAKQPQSSAYQKQQEVNFNPLAHHRWADTQDSNPAVKLVKELLIEQSAYPDENAPEETHQLWKERGKMFLYQGKLCRRYTNPKTHELVWQIIVPKQDVKMVLEAYHNGAGHFGWKKLEVLLRERFYWVGMRKSIEQWCRNCGPCNLRRNDQKNQRAPLQPIITKQPLELVAIDHVKLTPSRSGYVYALTIVDHYSRFLVVVPVKDLTARTAAKAFQTYFCRPHGYPEQVLTDQGPAFESEIFREFCNMHGCKKIRTTAYHPQTNGLCEKMNHIIIDLLKTLPESERNQWPEKLPDLVDLYNHVPVSSTNCTPAYLMRARPGQLPIDLEMGILKPDADIQGLDWDTIRQKQYRQVQESVERSLQQTRERQERTFNQNALATPLKPGDQVLKRNRRTNKLDNQWETVPYTVLPARVNNPKMCLISKDGGLTSVLVSRDNLKLCPEALKEPAIIQPEPEVIQPVQVQPAKEEEEEVYHTALGDFPKTWPTFYGSVLVPVMTYYPTPESVVPEAPRQEVDPVPQEATRQEEQIPGRSDPGHGGLANPIVVELPLAERADIMSAVDYSTPQDETPLLRRSQRSTQGQIPARYADYQL